MRVAFIATLVLGCGVASADGIIANGDIEVGGAQSATGWASDVRDGDYEFSVAGEAHEGERCLAIACTGEPGWARWYTTDFFLLEGGTYELTLWVKTAGEEARGECWLTGGGNALVFHDFGETPQWTPLRASFTATETGRVGLYLQGRGRGSVYFDDVAVSLVSVAASGESTEAPTNGPPLTAIVIPLQNGPHHTYLAVEARRVIEKMTGATLPVTTGAVEGRAIYIGVAPDGSDYSEDFAQLTDEGIILDISDDAIVCLGKTPRAEYYAVQELLYVLGCRWIMPEGPGECIPEVNGLTLPAQKIVHSPPFELRGSKTVQVYHYPPDMDSTHVPVEPWVDWAARNRMNGLKASYPWTWDYGAIRGHQYSEWSGHTLYHILPPEDYFDEHPEYYTLVKGERTHLHSSGRPSMVCVSNPDLPRIIADRAIELFDSDPHAERFAVGAEDEPSYWCECEPCKALDTEPVDWSTNGEKTMPMTDRWLYLINQVADLVAERHPDKYIHTFAYASTRQPPKEHLPRPNVMIELCWWYRCFKHDMPDRTCPTNRQGMQLFERWRKLSPIAIYGYLDYHNFEAPCPYYHSDADFYQTVHARGVRHISDEWDSTFTSSPLLLNLRARLLWDLETDVDAYIEDFCRIAYGPAAEHVEAYFRALEAGVGESELEHVGLNELGKFDDRLLSRCRRTLGRAMRAAGEDADVQGRVARLQFSLMFAELRVLQERLEEEPELYARTEPLKANMHRIVQEYEIPVILGAYNAFAASYRPPVKALAAENLAELPEMWRFRADPEGAGEDQRWQSSPPDDSWQEISTHAAWEGQGHEGYDGYGWYTVEAELPEATGRVWLLFGAVDETCRVWIDGQHAGDSDGDPGVLWDKPVAVEITGKYRPGESNRITVRVHDSAYAGGIWKPVEVRAEKQTDNQTGGNAMSDKVIVAAHPWVFASRLEGYDIFPVIDDVIADMAYAGFDGIELMHTTLLNDGAVETIRAASDRHSLPVIGSSFGGAMWDAEQADEVLAQADLCTTRLAELGGRTLGVSTGGAPAKKTPEQLDCQADVLRKIGAMCRERGIVMNLHNHTYEVADGEYELAETLKRFPEAKLGPDLDWLTRAGVDPIDFIRRRGEAIVFLHLRDNKDGHWVEGLGEGEMDFAAIKAALDEAGFRGIAAVELAWESDFEPTRPLRETLKLSREHIRETMGW